MKSYKPSLTGQKYVFAAMALATTQLGQSYLYDDSYPHDADVAYAFMQQLSLKSALKQWGTNAEDAGVKEISHCIGGIRLSLEDTPTSQTSSRRRFSRATCLS